MMNRTMPTAAGLAVLCLGTALAAQRPFAHYPLNGNLRDAAGTNHGTFEGTGGAHSTATFVPDSAFGTVLSFDGTDDRVNLGPIMQFQNNSWSVSFWFQTTEAPTTGVLGKNDGNVAFSRGERTFEITGPNSWTGLGANRANGNFAVNGHSMAGIAVKRTECSVDVALNDGSWHMIAIAHDETGGARKFDVYIDGKLASSTTGFFDNNTQPDVGNFYLGFSNYSGNNGVDYLRGKMAQVNFFNRAITSIDILLLHAPFARSLTSGTTAIPVAAGGRQDLRIDAAPCLANQAYWVFGSITGTSPGTPLGGLTIPLNVDIYTSLAMGLVNTPVFVAFRGTLDAKGTATASFVVPANQAIPINTKVYHACLVYSPTRFLMATNAVEVTFVR